MHPDSRDSGKEQLQIQIITLLFGLWIAGLRLKISRWDRNGVAFSCCEAPGNVVRIAGTLQVVHTTTRDLLNRSALFMAPTRADLDRSAIASFG